MTIEDDLARAETTAAEGMRFMAAEVSAPWLGRLKMALALLAIILIAAGGAWLAVKLENHPVPEATEAAPAVVQADGSQVVAREYTPHPKPAPHAIPKGFVEERREIVRVAPDTPKSDVEVDLSIVRKDNEVRVVASSPDGQITYAQDSIIIPSLTPPPVHKLAAGLSYSSERETGAWIEGDLGRWRLGAEVSKGAGRPRAELRVGVTF